MEKILNITEFNLLNLPEKFEFFESEVKNIVSSLDEKNLYLFFKFIITNSLENSNIRKKALESFINSVLLNKLKERQALSLLIDNWESNNEIFLELYRLNVLFLFYDKEPNEIESIYLDSLKNSELEIVSESYFNLGLIYMQKGLLSNTKEEMQKFLNESHFYFVQSNISIENRINSEFFEKTLSITIDIINENWGEVEEKLKIIAQLLFNIETFSFQFNGIYYVSFYRKLLSLQKIKKEQPSKWLDFRIELKNLFYQYSCIKNQELKNMLNTSNLSSIYISLLEKQFIEPYFALNFEAELTKIDILLAEAEVNSEEYVFLTYIKNLDNNPKSKKKTESIRDFFLNLFPKHNQIFIEELTSKIKKNNTLDTLSAFELIARKSKEELLNNIIIACLQLQGNAIYRKTDEDQRNTFISTILEARGHYVKDQTRWSKSAEGKASGELDIFVRQSDGTPFAIIEALNLDSLKQDYTALHLNKIFKYDANGLEINFILIYATAKKFIELWEKYLEFIKRFNYEASTFENFEEIDFGYSKIKIGKAKHIVNKKQTFLYHIMIDLNNE